MGRRSDGYPTRRGGHPHRLVGLAVLVSSLLAALFLLPGTAVDAGAVNNPYRQSTVRIGFAPEVPATAHVVTPLASSTALHVDVVLQPKDPAGLTSYAQAVSAPTSGQYRHYLSERQFVARFGPTAGTISAVRRALVNAGLQPGTISSDDLSIPIRATAAQLASAFSTGFKRYQVAGGRIAYANTDAPQISGAIASDVQSVVGLDDLNLAMPAAQQSTGNAVPARTANESSHAAGPVACRTAALKGEEFGSYTANQVGTAYGFPSLYNQGDLGAGQAVALYELQGFGTADIATYAKCFGVDTPMTTVNVDNGPLANSGVSEADVDIEQVMSLAPDVRIYVYQGPNDGAGGYDTYQSIISADQAKVISTSWGLCERFTGSPTAEAENTLFEEAAVQGQTVVAATGDEGSEDCVTGENTNNTLAVDDPASQPFVTGVGGTQWTARATPPTEQAWNSGPTCCWGAGGGGVSSLWAMPSYQSGAAGIGTVNAYSSATPCRASVGSYCREVPDVSALAGQFPYLDYVGGGWGSWGGTSLAAPLWASLIALSNASPTCAGKDIGFANPILYEVAAAEPAAFNDVTVGNNDLTGKFGTTYPATAGYDMATGLGTPNAALLPSALCASAQANPVVVTDPGKQSTRYASAVHLQMHVTEAAGGGKLTYRAVGLPPGVTINSSTGVISGSPTSWGTFQPFVSVRDADTASGSTSFSWSVLLAITSASSSTATIGRSFSFTVRTTGTPNSLSVSPKPPWPFRFKNEGNGTAILSGNVVKGTSVGNHRLVFEAVFGTKTAETAVSQTFTLKVAAGA